MASSAASRPVRRRWLGLVVLALLVAVPAAWLPGERSWHPEASLSAWRGIWQADDRAVGVRFVTLASAGEVAFVARDVIEASLDARGATLTGDDRERLDRALAWVARRNWERALVVTELLAAATGDPALSNNLAALQLATGRSDDAVATLATAETAAGPEAVDLLAALRFNRRQAARIGAAAVAPLSLPAPAAVPGLSARLVRFADTGGLLTAEVVFANLSDREVRFCPALARSRLIDEAHGGALTPRFTLTVACPVVLLPAAEWLAWVKFERPAAAANHLSLDFAGVNRVFSHLEVPAAP